MLGLNDVHIAHVPIALGEGASGHEKHDGPYVLSRRPDVILLGLPELHFNPPDPAERERLVKAWFGFLPGDRELYEDPAFAKDYVPIAGKAGDYAYVIAFVRRGGAYAPADD